ncbi:hypothetical protein PsorP6_003457 [Peronosclerospora sorghi]|uniref:Uncharacterized protein n=1 Tax=Peronosclerospora sorghi TaxID=230839 RepID=A0ACC0VQ41_9STRA|nr:hypothetical protein PsorP6_003457 [Peronosclerospora sorghi]
MVSDIKYVPLRSLRLLTGYVERLRDIQHHSAKQEFTCEEMRAMEDHIEASLGSETNYFVYHDQRSYMRKLWAYQYTVKFYFDALKEDNSHQFNISLCCRHEY